jgi:hypothetical protein
MLPALLGLVGSGLAGAGVLGTLTPLLAGALGSGLGSFIETGDLGEGIKTGLMSFAGGQLAGSLLGGAGGGLSPTAQAVGIPGMEATPLAQQAAQIGNVPPQLRPEAMGAGAGSKFWNGLGAASYTPANAAAGADPLTGMRAVTRAGMDYGMTPEGMGAAAGSIVAPALGPLFGQRKKDKDERDWERPEYDPFTVSYPSGSPTGQSREHLYGFPGPYTRPRAMYGGGALGYTPRLAGGGIANLPEAGLSPEMAAPPEMAPPPEMAMPSKGEVNDKQLINATVAAIVEGGASEESKIALAMFIARFGEDALMDLIESVQSGEFMRNEGDGEGMVRGPGDAMDDMVPAQNVTNGQDILLSGEEFIVPGDVVSGLGNGSSEAGADELYSMMDRVRMARTGTVDQPPRIRAGGMLPA